MKQCDSFWPDKDRHPAHSHVEHTSAESVNDANTNGNVVTSGDTPTNSVLTNLLTPTSVSKEHSPTFHSVPASKGPRQTGGARLSTISSVSGSCKRLH